MILHMSTVVMSNTSFTRTSALTQSSPAEQLSRMNAEAEENRERMNTECTDVCNCVWHHSAIRLHAVSATLEDYSFQHTDAGALSLEEDSLLTLKQVSFESEADGTPHL